MAPRALFMISEEEEQPPTIRSANSTADYLSENKMLNREHRFSQGKREKAESAIRGRLPRKEKREKKRCRDSSPFDQSDLPNPVSTFRMNLIHPERK